MMEKSKWLVIGSNSFSGAHCVEALLRSGSTVVGVSRSREAHPAFLPYRWNGSGNQGFQFHQLDLNQHMAELRELLHEFQPDYVVNFAAQGMVAQSWEHPDHWYQTNLVAMVRLHEVLRELEGLKRYVHVSTPEVYGSCEGLVTEDQSFNPSTPYAVSRAACDMSLMAYHRAYKFPVVFTRAANVFGPGQQLYRIIPRTILAIRTGGKLPLHGGGYSERSFIHIGDVIRGTLAIAVRGTPGRVYHLATDSLISIRQLVQRICDLMEVDFDSVVEETGERLGKDKAYRLDCRRVYSELGWEADCDLEAGLRETIDWVDKHLNELKQMPWEYQHKP
jgi:dTDP-glucose 4,6-dehydratase